ncbi:acyl-CoA dehydrogenase family protein [Novosphingobium malaysiense]|uniref:Acyl-CoA dehydrogenase n=1 Tax=Novosphingobium malaysiense TaxID=1348853 RepID=A0A0B1ZKH3_9SPHN|nr:acyl-CoA dehydrogenase family protein [Novosphingobium malaysiense]KHK89839.1 acyl-CoA dehydrogenase [Novosphingobium malaysiense]
MRHVLTPDQELFQDTTARFLADRAPLSRLRKLRDDPAGYEPDYWRDGGELGWCMPLVGEDEGGGSVSGRGIVDLSLLAYEFGRHAAPGPLVDCNVVAAALSGQPGEMQQNALGEVLTGKAIAASCLGAAPWQELGKAGVTIRKDGSQLVISGSVRPVESASQASWLLVTGASDGGRTQVLVPASATGLEVRPLKSIDVTRRFGQVTFADVHVPESAIVGTFAEAEAQIAQQIRHAAVILTAESVGAMDSAFDMTVDWAFERYTFGRALASYQALKHRFADMKSWLEASHAISDAAADAVADASDTADEVCSAAKSYVGQQGVELAQDCVQLHGGIGVTYEHDLHFYLRRVTLDRLLYGTPAEHRRMIGSMQIKQDVMA